MRVGLIPAMLMLTSIACSAEMNAAETINDPRAAALAPLRMFNEYHDPGVVMVAISNAADVSAEPLIHVQMSMLDKVLQTGPAFIAVEDNTARARISAKAGDFPVLSAALRNGNARYLQIAHDGPWVRDYGPQIGTHDTRVRVLDASYVDERQKRQSKRMQGQIDKARLSLLAKRERLDDKIGEVGGRYNAVEGAEAEVLADDDVEREKRMIDERLSILARKKDIYADHSMYARDRDDDSPFFIAQASFDDTAFELVHTKISLDGGNLVRLQGDVCALTTDIVPSNNEDVEIGRILGELYGCKQVLYLDPLPGDVIKHVDMFLLPASGKTVLLASYDLQNERLRGYWKQAEEEIRDLSMEAALAMDRNASILERAGFLVVRVPAPLPRVDIDQGAYYPTNLNALVRVNQRKSRSVLVPTYAGYEEDLQREAVDTIQKAFPGDLVETIESTAAARLQGAVHCLSIVIPFEHTVFANPRSVQKFREIYEVTAELAEEQRDLLRQLQGRWNFADAFEITFHVDGQATIRSSDSIVLVRYELKRGGQELTLSGPSGQSPFAMEIQWKNRNRIVARTQDGAVELRRLQQTSK